MPTEFVCSLYVMTELYIHLIDFTKFEPSHDKFRSKTSPFMVKLCIMITQERACKLQCLLQIQCQTSRSNYRLKTGTKYEDMKFDQPKLFLRNSYHTVVPGSGFCIVKLLASLWIPIEATSSLSLRSLGRTHAP